MPYSSSIWVRSRLYLYYLVLNTCLSRAVNMHVCSVVRTPPQFLQGQQCVNMTGRRDGQRRQGPGAVRWAPALWLQCREEEDAELEDGCDGHGLRVWLVCPWSIGFWLVSASTSTFVTEREQGGQIFLLDLVSLNGCSIEIYYIINLNIVIFILVLFCINSVKIKIIWLLEKTRFIFF